MMSCFNPKFHVAAFVAILSLLCIEPVLAQDLGSLKSQGVVGERVDGYLGVVDSSAPADVTRFVKDVNDKRKARYEQIAQQNDLTLQQVESRAGQRTVEKTPRGGWIYDGGWRKK